MYIEEAHALDEWPISSSRYMPNDSVVSVVQPKLASERVALAQRFVKTFELGSDMKILVDDPEKGNLFEVAYGKFLFAMSHLVSLTTRLPLSYHISAPWPIRLYVIENGVMQFISSPTECTHDVSELRLWLEQRHTLRV